MPLPSSYLPFVVSSVQTPETGDPVRTITWRQPFPMGREHVIDLARNLVYSPMHTAIAADMIRSGRQDRAISELDDIDALVRTHRARLLRFVTFSIGDEDVAASIVQDCFLKAYNKRADFRGDSSVATWLTTIALNLIRDHQRIRKFQFWRKAAKTATDVFEMASVLPGTGSSPEAQLLARERAGAVAEVLGSLSQNQRTVFLMRFSEEMDLKEIAESTGLHINTVKTHLHRALKTVRARLGEAQ